MNKEKFLKAIETLKLFSRSELLDDDGKKLITELYVDPLPNDMVLSTILRPTTTFLHGRKGTGKSTIFQRAQDSLDHDKKATWAYIDIKTLYESSTSELLGDVSPEIQRALSPESIQRLYLFKKFIIELVKEIKKQIDIRVHSTIWGTIKEALTESTVVLFDKLDEFIEELERETYLDVTGSVREVKNDEQSLIDKSKVGVDSSLNVQPIPNANLKFVSELVSEIESKKSQNYSKVFIRVFNIRGLITRLREILATLHLQHLYIFIDDFSELPKKSMEEVVDSILMPFQNWSDNFIKLKVAVYPGRLYLGEIDRTKVDEIYLDIYRAYGRGDVTDMEEKAIDFTKRLVIRRMEHFCEGDVEKYLEVESPELWRTIYYSCLGNPRILGYVLYYCYETSIIYDKRIGIQTIQNAAKRYYEEKIGTYFKLNKFLHETFEERSSIFSLKELLEEIIKRAKATRANRDSQLMNEITGRPPTSHFHIYNDYDAVLSSLELNFFVTKYFEMKDRDGREVSIYALNYGLCQQQTIAFGRPTGKREFRTYFIERIFDYSPIISSYIKINQEIVCEHCGKRHDHDMLPAIKSFDMLCPECKIGKCRIVNLSRKYEKLIKDVSEHSLLPETELGILKTLHDEHKIMFAKEIASELDCSYQLVGKRGRNLAERDLISRNENDKGRRMFKLSKSAIDVYFSEDSETDLNLS